MKTITTLFKVLAFTGMINQAFALGEVNTGSASILPICDCQLNSQNQDKSNCGSLGTNSNTNRSQSMSVPTMVPTKPTTPPSGGHGSQ